MQITKYHGTRHGVVPLQGCTKHDHEFPIFHFWLSKTSRPYQLQDLEPVVPRDQDGRLLDVRAMSLAVPGWVHYH